MDRKIILLVLVACLLSMNAFASMAMPVLGVNHETKECVEFFTGDECVYCELPSGWKALGDFRDANCPEGYAVLETFSVDSVCTSAKIDFCCTINHSGAGGDCEDLVVNDVEKKCAFVEDIAECEKLPAGWQSAPIDEFLGRLCPSYDYGYEWLEDYLKCEPAGNGGNGGNSDVNGNGGNDGNGNGGSSAQGSETMVYAAVLLFILIIGIIAFKKFRK